MINGKRIAAVMPAFNAAPTLERTVAALPDVIDVKILVDDFSSDNTVELARELGLVVRQHDKNHGYGRNQKTCYELALSMGVDIVVMVHPDYQYDPALVPVLAGMIAYGVYDVAIGSRIVGGGALKGGMPVYKYVANRLLTAVQNLTTGAKLSEYHTGFRAFSRRALSELPLAENVNGFVFDNQILLQAMMFGLRLGEVSCPTRYFPEASSINFTRSIGYGCGVLLTTVQFLLHKWGLVKFPLFDPAGKKLTVGPEIEHSASA